MTKARPIEVKEWRRPQFWRNLFLYFWGFSFIGHVLEIPWAMLGNALGLRASPASTIPLFSIAAPYGLGAVMLYLLLFPLVKKKRIGIVRMFIFGALITTMMEFISAALVAAFVGYNPFWNYSGRIFNLYGWVCLTNSLLFGVGSVVLLRWVFPFTERILGRIKPLYLNIAFWVLFIGYALWQICFRIF